MKILILIIITLILFSNADVIVNLIDCDHNGANSNNTNNNLTVISYIYYDPFYFNGLGLDSNATNEFDRAIWDEILVRNPSIVTYINPTYSLHQNLWTDFYDHVAECEMDAFATSTYIYPTLLESGVVAASSLIYVANESFWSAFTNLPASLNMTNGNSTNGNSTNGNTNSTDGNTNSTDGNTNSTNGNSTAGNVTNLCYSQPNCSDFGFCSNYTLESIVEFANQNNNPTIHICYSPNTFFYDYALLIQDLIMNNLSYSNVELFEFPSGRENYEKLLNNISTIDPTQDIYYAINPYNDGDFCYLFSNQSSPFPLSVAQTPGLPSYPLSYVFCPQKTELIEMVNNTINELHNEDFICQLRVDILSFCVSDSSDPEDRCTQFSGAPKCENSTSTGNSTRRNIIMERSGFTNFIFN